MYRTVLLLLVFTSLLSCSKKNNTPVTPPVVIPSQINGTILEFTVTPVDINTPGKGTFIVVMNGTGYQVDFNAVDQASSNSTLSFDNDSILTVNSREFTNLGKDAIAYQVVRANKITIDFADGRKVTGFVDDNTSFGGNFGEQLIAQWRDPADPAKPTQKAKDDLMNFVHRYADQDGPGPAMTPVYLSTTVSQH